MKRCIRAYIEATSVVIGGVYSDPGGAKHKEARENCAYQCRVPSLTWWKFG